MVPTLNSPELPESCYLLLLPVLTPLYNSLPSQLPNIPFVFRGVFPAPPWLTDQTHVSQTEPPI